MLEKPFGGKFVGCVFVRLNKMVLLMFELIISISWVVNDGYFKIWKIIVLIIDDLKIKFLQHIYVCRMWGEYLFCKNKSKKNLLHFGN